MLGSDSRAPSEDASFFAGLSDSEVVDAMSGLPRRLFAPGSIVLEEGDVTRQMYVIVSGSAEVLVTGRDGVEHRLGQVEARSSLGEMSLLTGMPTAATVRALEPLEAVALDQEGLDRLALRYPRLYRNLGAILAERLARTNRLAIAERPGRVSVLADAGAPALVAYALAASIAWHTRRPTLLLFADETASGRLPSPFQEVEIAGDLSVQSLSTGTGLEPALERLSQRFEHILVYASGSLPTISDAQVVTLAGDGPTPTTSTPLHVRAWTATGELRLNQGLVDVPHPSDAELDALRRGSLPNAGPAGRPLGAVARRLAGLRVGVALGAGSVRGFAHCGVLGALERHGIEPDAIAGTSIGAAVAGLAAHGSRAAEIADILERCGETLVRFGPPRAGLLSSRGVRKFIRGMVGDDRLEDLPIPTAVVAVDLDTQREIVLRHGLIWLAVLASISIPGVYPPVRVGSYRLVDGGVLNPVPSDVAAELGADIVLAVRILPAAPERESAGEAMPGKKVRAPSAVNTIIRSIETMQTGMGPRHADVSLVAIAPRLVDVPGARLRRFAEGRRFIEAGDEAAEAALPRLAAALPWLAG